MGQVQWSQWHWIGVPEVIISFTGVNVTQTLLAVLKSSFVESQKRTGMVPHYFHVTVTPLAINENSLMPHTSCLCLDRAVVQWQLVCQPTPGTISGCLWYSPFAPFCFSSLACILTLYTPPPQLPPHPSTLQPHTHPHAPSPATQPNFLLLPSPFLSSMDLAWEAILDII